FVVVEVAGDAWAPLTGGDDPEEARERLARHFTGLLPRLREFQDDPATPRRTRRVDRPRRGDHGRRRPPDHRPRPRVPHRPRRPHAPPRPRRPGGAPPLRPGPLRPSRHRRSLTRGGPEPDGRGAAIAESARPHAALPDNGAVTDLDSGPDGPQPFAHLSVPNAALYREVLLAFGRAKERFIVHLRPEDVAAELRRDGDDGQLAQALEKLVEWGNLRADADTGRVTTVEDFHRKRFLFQLTAAGQAAEQAIAFYEEAIGRRGVLQSVALTDIADHLAALSALADEQYPDAGRVQQLLLTLAERFASLADNAQAFMASLRRAIDFSDGDVEGFIAYKERLIDYINRFIADLANSGARIAALLDEVESRGHERLLGLAARREASDAVPEGADAAEAFARAEAAALESWRNRWRGLRDWFVSAGAAHPSQARLLRQSAVTAIKQLVDTVGLLNERRSGRSDRSADFRTLARWFAEAPDDAAMHRLWRAAFGLTSARHLTVTAATVAAWEDEAPHGLPW